MTDNGLITLVVGYDDVGVALEDLADLETVKSHGRVDDYQAAVVRRGDPSHELVATTVDPRMHGTLLGACLGAVIGTVLSPVLAVAAVGAGLGGVFGNLGDQIDAFRNADMREVERLVDDSTANLIVIADAATVHDIERAASSRDRRIVVSFSEADIDLVERELQRMMSFGS